MDTYFTPQGVKNKVLDFTDTLNELEIQEAAEQDEVQSPPIKPVRENLFSTFSIKAKAKPMSLNRSSNHGDSSHSPDRHMMLPMLSPNNNTIFSPKFTPRKVMEFNTFKVKATANDEIIAKSKKKDPSRKK